MNTGPAPTLTIEIKAGIPLIVNGGLTRWQIHVVYQGKNGSYFTVACDCLTNPDIKFNLKDGRRSDSVRPHGPHTAIRGSMLFKVFSKLVREGRALIIEHDDEEHQRLLTSDRVKQINTPLQVFKMKSSGPPGWIENPNHYGHYIRPFDGTSR